MCAQRAANMQLEALGQPRACTYSGKPCGLSQLPTHLPLGFGCTGPQGEGVREGEKPKALKAQPGQILRPLAFSAEACAGAAPHRGSSPTRFPPQNRLCLPSCSFSLLFHLRSLHNRHNPFSCAEREAEAGAKPQLSPSPARARGRFLSSTFSPHRLRDLFPRF